MKYLMIFGALLALLVSFAAAQPNEPSRQPAPSWVIPAEIPADANKEGAEDGIFYLLADEQVRLDNDGYERFVRYAVEVLSRSGLEEAAQFDAGYDPTNSTIRIHELSVIRDGETISHLNAVDIRTARREEELDDGVSDGWLTVFAQIPDVRVGDVVITSHSRRVENPLWPGELFDTFSLGFSSPTGTIYRRLLTPKDKPLAIRSHEVDIQPRIGSVDGFDEREWVISNARALQGEQDSGWETVHWPFVSVSTMQEWADVADWALPLYAQDPSLPDDMQRLLSDVREEKPERNERITWALRFVQDEIRYVSDSEGLGSHRPRPPAVTLANRFGDCKDKTVLLIRLLDTLDVEAVPILVHSEKGKRLPLITPAPTRFDHVIVGIIEDDGFAFLDPTNQLQGGIYPNIAEADFGHGLPVEPGTDLVSMKPQPKDKPELFITHRFDLPGPDRDDMAFTSTSVRRASEADRYRNILDANSREELAAEWLEFYADTYPGLKMVSEPSISDDRDSNVLRVTEHYKLGRDQFNQIHDDFPFYAEGIDVSMPDVPVADRTSPVVVEFPAYYRHDLIVAGPTSGYGGFEEIDERTGPVRLTLTNLDTDKTLHARWEVQTFDDRISVADLAEYDEASENFFSWESSSYEFYDAETLDAWYLNETFITALTFVVGTGACLGLAFWTFRHDDKFDGARSAIPIPLTKWVILNIISLGYYGYLWAWRSWRQGEGKTTVGTAFLSAFLTFTFYYFYEYAARGSRKFNKGLAALLAVGFLFLGVLAKIGDDFGASALTTFLASYSAWLFLLAPLRAVLAANEANEDALNYHARWTPRTFVGMAIGILFSTLIIAGMFAA